MGELRKGEGLQESVEWKPFSELVISAQGMSM
jgi:hypothetical protein